MAPKDDAPPDNQIDRRAALGRPEGAGSPGFAEIAATLLDNGYAPLPIRPDSKVPAVPRWSQVTIDETTLEGWIARHGGCGTGLRTGSVVGLDIDILDEELAHEVMRAAQVRFGETLLRVGLWPKRMLLYRTEEPFAKLKIPGVEILGLGQQFVAFGRHPGTGRPYDWPLGDTPLDTPAEALPLLDRDAVAEFLGEIAGRAPAPQPPRRSPAERSAPAAGEAPLRNDAGLVVDGRDGWLSRIAYHAVQDAIEAGAPLDPAALAAIAWSRFAASTDLDRPAGGSGRGYAFTDALAKIDAKLRLHAAGTLPARETATVEAEFEAPTMLVDAARHELRQRLEAACADILEWHAAGLPVPAPRIGLRATVGLGKSSLGRTALTDLRDRLKADGHPERLVVFTPSHVLAEETAAAWRGLGAVVAVLRGYGRVHPVFDAPMCRDTEAVQAALAAGLDPQRTVCEARNGVRCAMYDGCLKQLNRAEVAAADVVVAPYDALYSGFAVEEDSIGAVVVDEGCSARAVTRDPHLTVQALDVIGAGVTRPGRNPRAAAGRAADLMALRGRLRTALMQSADGPVRRDALVSAGLTAEDCRLAAGLEHAQLADPGLRPGLTGTARRLALTQAHANETGRRLAGLWATLGGLLEGTADCDGRVGLGAADPRTGLRPLICVGLKSIDKGFRDRPILHLDATLRPGIAGRLLPRLEVTEIEAAAPHMAVTLVAGRFGKSAIVPEAHCNPQEAARRQANLGACVDHVRWHGRRLNRVLVITYKAIEGAFAGIPGVETAHFNAIAGLDIFGDIDGLFVIGRPLPRDTDLAPFCAAFEGHVPQGGYAPGLAGIRMRDGSSRGVAVIRHRDPIAETFRAAICDDELVQAIGRGRGVNRTAANPLEVHLLADVALPLVHDRLLVWDTVRPDMLQRMLLAGVAVDSPADATVLHPDLFGSANAAKMAFRGIVFKGQTPMEISYRDLTLKSAAYRRAGRGRSWQRAWWIDGAAEEVRAVLQARLGGLAGWRSDGA